MAVTETSVPSAEDTTEPTDATAPRGHVPQNYDRTWELELLISGAVAFTPWRDRDPEDRPLPPHYIPFWVGR